MRKALLITVFFIVFLLIYFLQSNFFSWYNIAGIQPNLFIVFVLFISLYAGKNYGFSLGIIFGIFIDFFVGKKIGLNAIMLGIAGILGGMLDRSFSKESRITCMLMTLEVTFTCEFINYFLQILLLNVDFSFQNAIKIIAIETMFNLSLVMILYPLIRKSRRKNRRNI